MTQDISFRRFLREAKGFLKGISGVLTASKKVFLPLLAVLMLLLLIEVRVFLLALALCVVALILLYAFALRRVLFKKPMVGVEGLIGLTGTVVEWRGVSGLIFVHGELWRATSDTAFKKGDKVVVTGVTTKRGVKSLIVKGIR